MLLLVLASLVFAVAGLFMAIHSTKGFHIVVGWISVVFFGLGGLYMLYRHGHEGARVVQLVERKVEAEISSNFLSFIL